MQLLVDLDRGRAVSRAPANRGSSLTEAVPLGIQLHILNASADRDLDTMFDALVQLHADTLLIGTDSFFNSRTEQLAAVTRRAAVPAIYSTREFATAGGLMSYGASLTDSFRQVGVYVGRVLKGEKPTNLPVQQPTKFDLVINIKTARALGLNYHHRCWRSPMR